MFLLGLGHKARQGKDTFADTVKEQFGDRMQIQLASFADPLRQEIRQAAYDAWLNFQSEAYGLSPGNLPPLYEPRVGLRLLCKQEGIEYEEGAPVDSVYPWGKQRKLLQYWGTEKRRAVNPYYWTDKAVELIGKAKECAVDVLIFRDMRFHNEYELIGALGGFRQKVVRLGYISDVPPHRSESELDDAPFDGVLGVGEDLPLLKRLSAKVFEGILSI